MLRRAPLFLVALAVLLSGALPSHGGEPRTGSGAVAGAPGIGDPYFPLDGNGGINVLSYDVHDDYRFSGGRLSGWTKVTLRTTEKLSSFNLDFLLPVQRVRLSTGASGFSRPSRHELRIRPRKPIPAGTTVRVRVDYAGYPGKVSWNGERNWMAYEFVVTNTGNVTVSEPTISDPTLEEAGITVSCPGADVAPESSVTCTASGPYVITQADVDAGGVTNVATAGGDVPPGVDPGEDAEDTTVTPTADAAKIDLKETADTSLLVAGEEITFTYTATNTGDVTLSEAYQFEVHNTGDVAVSGIRIKDRKLAAAGIEVSCPQPVLAPGESMVCAADKPYRITQADVDDGGVTNSATAGGKLPDGVTQPPPVTDTLTTPTVARRPGVSFDKRVGKTRDVDHDGRLGLGDEIYYEFQVTNTGNVTLSHLKVHDHLLTRHHIGVTCNPDTVAPGRAVMCRADAPYRISAADVEAGQVVNSAVVDLDGPGDLGPQPPTSDEVTFYLGGGSTGGTLPNTGVSSWVTLAVPVGLLLLAAGLLLVATRRRGRDDMA